MAIVPAICTKCGAQISVDNNQDAGVCKHCGTPFIIEKAIYQYVINNNINPNISARDFLNKALSYYRIGEKDKAKEALIEARSQEPDNGEFLFVSYIIASSFINIPDTYYDRYKKIQVWEIQWIEYWGNEISQYGDTTETSYGSPCYTDASYNLQSYFNTSLKNKCFDRCIKVLEKYPGCPLLPKTPYELGLFIKECGNLYKGEWPDLSIFRFLFENDKNREFKPYKEHSYNFYHPGVERDDRKVKVSIYDIIHSGGQKYDYYGSKLTKMPSNYELEQLIKEFYPLQEGKCPKCGKSFNIFGKCKACRKH